MTGVVNSTGARSGAIGTIVGTPAATNAADVGSGVLPVGVTGGSGLTALGTVTAGTLGTGVTFPAGSAVQIETTYSNSDTTIDVSSNNVWQDTGITDSITPRYNNSKILIFISYSCTITNSSGDGGFGVRFKRAISGGATSYPATASVQEGTGNAHSVFYHGAAPTSGNWVAAECHTLIDAPATTSAVTYTLQGATYNAEACQIGGLYTSYWHLHLMEIKV